MGFPGFTPEALDFLMENRLRNDKEWYRAHKAEYERLVAQPCRLLIGEMTDAMRAIDPYFMTDPSRLISRVYRDARFTKDKSFFRDNVWFSFIRDRKAQAYTPCFWFELGQQGVSYGVGYFAAETASMRAMREMALAREPRFMEALCAYQAQSVFGIGGETYKKSRHPDEPRKIREWVDRKNIYFCRDEGCEAAFSPELAQTMCEQFLLLRPIYDFFLAVESRRAGGPAPAV